MARPRYKPVTPDQRIRQLRKDFKHLQNKVEPGPERAEQLAAFTRAAHEERQLNMAMHTASQCLEEDPDAPALLLEAYIAPDLDDPEDRLRAFVDLADLARYVDSDAIKDYVEQNVHDEARTWIESASEAERRHRLRTLASMFDREFSDRIRDEIAFG